MSTTAEQLRGKGFVEQADGSFAKARRSCDCESLSGTAHRTDCTAGGVGEPHSSKLIAPRQPVAHENEKQSTEDRLNKTEKRFLAILKARQHSKVWCQSITLALDPPFRSYRPDMAYLVNGLLTFVEVKGPHRFRRAGIAKAALAAKTYPEFRFELAEWDGTTWKETVLGGFEYKCKT